MTLTPTYGVVPAMGFGTYQRTGDAGLAAIRHALDVGYRHLDTASFYENEAEVGLAMRSSGIPREEIFLTTKVWYTELGAGQVRASAEASLKRLGMDYVDLLLIHWPSPDDAIPVAQYIEELASVKAAGLTRHIGVSNFTRRHIDEAVAVVGAGEIATNQCELNVTFQNGAIRDHCNALGIPMTAYLPLSKGRAASGAELERLADKHGATAAQISLAWLLAKGHIAIPSSSSAARIEENFCALNVSLSAGDLMALDALDTGERKVNVAWAPAWDDD